MNEAVEFYRQQLVAQARSMPMCEAVIFLRGALEMAGERAEMSEVRSAHQALVVADDQLELIASGQLKLNLGEAAK